MTAMKLRPRTIMLAIAVVLSPLYLMYGWVLRCDCHPIYSVCHCGAACGCPNYWSPYAGAIACIALLATMIWSLTRRRRWAVA